MNLDELKLIQNIADELKNIRFELNMIRNALEK